MPLNNKYKSVIIAQECFTLDIKLIVLVNDEKSPDAFIMIE